MSKRKMCELCGRHPATVPDRNRMGRPINRVCSYCHSDRLRGDLAIINEISRQKIAAAGNDVAKRTAFTADGCPIAVGMTVWSRDGVGGVQCETVGTLTKDESGAWWINRPGLPLAARCAYAERAAAVAREEAK